MSSTVTSMYRFLSEAFGSAPYPTLMNQIERIVNLTQGDAEAFKARIYAALSHDYSFYSPKKIQDAVDSLVTILNSN